MSELNKGAKEYEMKCKGRQAKVSKIQNNKLFNLGKAEKSKILNRVIYNSQTKNRNADNLTKTTWGKGCSLVKLIPRTTKEPQIPKLNRIDDS